MKNVYWFTVLFCFFAQFVIFQENLKSEDAFVVITPEKTGTHLLTKLVSRLVKKDVHNCWEHEMGEKDFSSLLDAAEQNNCYVHMHALPTHEIINTLKKKKYKVLFLMRDPRDVTVSLFYYIEKGWSIGPCGLDRPYGQLSPNEKLHELITGQRYGLSVVHSIIVRRLAWMHQKNHFVYTSYFEKLVGEEGGGNYKDQLREIFKIAKHIGLNLTQAELKAVALNLWGAEPGEKTTFRKGQIGSWKTEFSEEHTRSFKKRFNSLLTELGYEENSHW